ncbi:MAG: LysR family transcriptional regulator [Deferrisomatales bacterium]|nr:LysR family transcriptional regulator [Deferrisomatales bacterium]
MRFDLNLKHLKVFYYVAKNLSFTRAAEELFISQPAVTMQISALEKQYGLRLFSRKKNELSLTEPGRLLYRYAAKVVEIAFEAERALLNLKANPQGLLRVGTTKTITRYWLTPYILRFQQAFPRVKLQLDEGSSEEMALSLLYGRNDIAIVGRHRYRERLEAFPFPAHAIDPLVLVLSPGHHLAGRAEVALEEIVGEPLILRETGSGTRHVLQTLMEGAGVHPNVLLEAGNVDFIKDLVRRGAGVSIVSAISVADEVACGDLCAVPLAGNPSLHIDIVVPEGVHRTEALSSFMDFLLAEAAADAE